jgi:hypothetical protein
MGIKELVSSGIINIQREVFIKRINAENDYEDDWYDITPWLISFPELTLSIGDDVQLGDYEIETFDLQLDNSRSKFNLTDSQDSIFYGFKKRNQTLFKLVINIYDKNNTEYNILTYYAINYDDWVNSSGGLIICPCADLLKVFEWQNAFGVDQASCTTGEMIQRLVYKKDNGQYYFLKFFDDNLQTSYAGLMEITSPEIKDGQTVWEKIKDYSKYQDYYPYIDVNQKINWVSKEATASVQYIFNAGSISGSNDYGQNIIDISVEQNNIQDLWTTAAIETNKIDGGIATSATATSITDTTKTWIVDSLIGKKITIIAGTGIGQSEIITDNNATQLTFAAMEITPDTTSIYKITGDDIISSYSTGYVINDGSARDLYGDRIFSESMQELTQNNALEVATRIVNNSKMIKFRYEIKTPLCNVKLCDRVQLNVRGYQNSQYQFIIGVSKIGDKIGGRQGNINLNSFEAKIIKIKYNPDLTMDILIKEI